MDLEASRVCLKLVKKTPLRGSAFGMCQIPPHIYQNHHSLERTGSEVFEGGGGIMGGRESEDRVKREKPNVQRIDLRRY